MKTLVNTEAKIPKKLFESLCLFETWCVAKRKDSVSEQEVKQWLEERFGLKMADQFKPEFLYP